MKIEVKNLTKYFGNFTALQDINLDIVEGELLALLGPSGKVPCRLDNCSRILLLASYISVLSLKII